MPGMVTCECKHQVKVQIQTSNLYLSSVMFDTLSLSLHLATAHPPLRYSTQMTPTPSNILGSLILSHMFNSGESSFGSLWASGLLVPLSFRVERYGMDNGQQKMAHAIDNKTAKFRICSCLSHVEFKYIISSVWTHLLVVPHAIMVGSPPAVKYPYTPDDNLPSMQYITQIGLEIMRQSK